MTNGESGADTRPRVLIVDDDPGNLMTLGRLLHAHYPVSAAPSGERALAIAGGDTRPDLILLDVMMPGMSGYEVLQRLRAAPETRDIPVIFVTGMDAEDDEAEGLRLGAADYLTKPYRPAVVLARVATQLALKEAQDLLSRRNASLEDDLARREAILHSVTAAARDAIVMIDGSDRIVFWNPAAEQLFGYSAAEALGRALHPLVLPERYRAAAAEGLANFFRTGRGAAVGGTVELAALRRDGSEFPMELSLSAIRREEAWWSVGIVRDITARKALAAELERAQERLLQADKLAAIGQLAAGVAHEINNPIGFVSSNMNSLQRYVQDILEVLDAYQAAAGRDDPAVLALAAETHRRKDLDYLRGDLGDLIGESREGLERVRRIVEDLKGFARADESRWEWADLHAVLESTLNIVRNEIKYHCAMREEFGVLPEVWCLPAQLGQVFMNLLVNAGQAIPGKGTITIRTGRRGEQVFVAVADTGSGIPAEHRHRLFDPFFTTKPVGKGTGLGLSVAWGIVSKHGGRFEVDSEPGRGSTFTVWLPIGPPGADGQDQ